MRKRFDNGEIVDLFRRDQLFRKVHFNVSISSWIIDTWSFCNASIRLDKKNSLKIYFGAWIWSIANKETF